ncbi:hypothetical protein [Mesorhizobium sp. M1B.F.Ca.ET.045.04.1.1]|uniref:hypothetical protein n=1 Tax=Mesorhizobium sp. M1B.F.Ca.ET.045.04.1.1 TaxID=2493673 RepID=UPI000F7500A6|nr:hypothetical protein [Mesorhizobium sp. M1B.F.Ca.ET.045.04.1.1]AZO29370.1 hypothetical protein EJ071_19585 [Mesorhizobium sp. M1B.F.Ca.ET.045.04.1.1]
MNKPLDAAARADLETITAADLDAFFAQHEARKVRHGKPFAKRQDGRDRRAERKAKEARRYDWFNT